QSVKKKYPVLESVNEELRPDELEHLAKQVASHKQWDNWEPTDKEVLDAIKKDKVFGKDLLKYSTTKQKKQAIKIIQAYLSESVNEAEGDISKFEYIAANVNTQDKFIKALSMLDDRIEAFGNRL
ncbi:MAG TPA: hypothetical protein DF712_01990, partial [Balneola sp.]|nr:hypothetical protein [Balneola sp.]